MTKGLWADYVVCIVIVLFAILTLGACASPREPRIVTVPVLTPVRAACVPSSIPAPQRYADASLPTAPDAAPERYQKMAEANEQRKARLAIIEPVIAACR